MARAEIARAQTAHMPSLVSVDSVGHQPISGCGSRASNRRFDRENHALEGASQRRRGVQSSLSRRKVDLPKAFHSDHLAPTGERSAEGRVRGSRRGAHQTTRRCRLGPPMRSKQNWHRDTWCAPSAHSVSIYYNGVFLRFRTCTYAVRGSKIRRNILSRMDLKFAENLINNTVARTARHEPAPRHEEPFFPTGQAADLSRGRSGSSGQSLTGVHQL
jgi:hypothetical protein